MSYIRKAKTRGGNDVMILLDLPDTIIGVYWTQGERYTGWIPTRWSKLNPFVNGRCASGLDLIEDITRIRL